MEEREERHVRHQCRIGTGREVKTSKLGSRGGWRGGREGATRTAENGVVHYVLTFKKLIKDEFLTSSKHNPNGD